MGLLVTLHLISSNVYGSLNAPPNRGFSYIEIWILCTQGTILLAIIEYGFILLFMRFSKCNQSGKVASNMYPNSTKENNPMNSLTLEERARLLDIATFTISLLFFVCFNIYYWNTILSF